MLEAVCASHRQRPDFVRVPFESLTSAADWIGVLQELRVDAVVNCVGIWAGSAQRFELVQFTVPVALFDACRALGLRIVHLSALGFSLDSPLPYASTKARADRYLLEHCPTGRLVLPSLVFGRDGDSSKFFLDLAALPVQVDFGLARNLQPVHVSEVAREVVHALVRAPMARTVECVGTHPISIVEYLGALRVGMGMRPALVTLRLPRWCGRWWFGLGELLGARFVNQQSWLLLQTGTQSGQPNGAALPCERFATREDALCVRDTQLYWFARLGVAFLWLWTAAVTLWVWPRHETMAWLDRLWPGLGSPFWLTLSCILDAAMGLAALVWPRTRLWQAQFALTTIYSVGLAIALPWTWAHPLGPLTKNAAVLFALAYLVTSESRRGR